MDSRTCWNFIVLFLLNLGLAFGFTYICDSRYSTPCSVQHSLALVRLVEDAAHGVSNEVERQALFDEITNGDTFTAGIGFGIQVIEDNGSGELDVFAANQRFPDIVGISVPDALVIYGGVHDAAFVHESLINATRTPDIASSSSEDFSCTGLTETVASADNTTTRAYGNFAGWEWTFVGNEFSEDMSADSVKEIYAMYTIKLDIVGRSYYVSAPFYHRMLPVQLPCSTLFTSPCVAHNIFSTVGHATVTAYLTQTPSQLQDFWDELGYGSLYKFNVGHYTFGISYVGAYMMAHGAVPFSAGWTLQELVEYVKIVSVTGNGIHSEFMAASRRGGGWGTYPWTADSSVALPTTKISFVLPFEKFGKSYYIGHGGNRITPVGVLPCDPTVTSYCGLKNTQTAVGTVMAQLSTSLTQTEVENVLYRVRETNLVEVTDAFYAVVLDSSGVILAHGDDPSLEGQKLVDVLVARGMGVEAALVTYNTILSSASTWGDLKRVNWVTSGGVLDTRYMLALHDWVMDDTLVTFGTYADTPPVYPANSTIDYASHDSVQTVTMLMGDVTSLVLAASGDMQPVFDEIDTSERFSPSGGYYAVVLRQFNEEGLEVPTVVAHGGNAALVGLTASEVDAALGLDAATGLDGAWASLTAKVTAGGGLVLINWKTAVEDTAQEWAVFVSGMTLNGVSYIGFSGYHNVMTPLPEGCAARFSTPCSVTIVEALIGKAETDMRMATSEEELESFFNEVTYGDSYKHDDGFYVFIYLYEGANVAHGGSVADIGLTLTDSFREKNVQSVTGEDVHGLAREVADGGGGYIHFPWSDDIATELLAERSVFVVSVSVAGRAYYLGSAFTDAEKPPTCQNNGCGAFAYCPAGDTFCKCKSGFDMKGGVFREMPNSQEFECEPPLASTGEQRVFWTISVATNAMALSSISKLAYEYMVNPALKNPILRSYLAVVLPDVAMACTYFPFHVANLLRGGEVDETSCKGLAFIMFGVVIATFSGPPIIAFVTLRKFEKLAHNDMFGDPVPHKVLVGLLATPWIIGFVLAAVVLDRDLLGSYRGLYCYATDYTDFWTGGITLALLCFFATLAMGIYIRIFLVVKHIGVTEDRILRRGVRLVSAMFFTWIMFAISAFLNLANIPPPVWMESLGAILISLQPTIDSYLIMNTKAVRRSRLQRELGALKLSTTTSASKNHGSNNTNNSSTNGGGAGGGGGSVGGGSGGGSSLFDNFRRRVVPSSSFAVGFADAKNEEFGMVVPSITA